MHSYPADHLDSPASVLIFTPCIHLVRMNVDILTSLLHFPSLDRGYIKSHFASLDDPFNPSQFQKCCLPSRIISNTQLKFPDLVWGARIEGSGLSSPCRSGRPDLGNARNHQNRNQGDCLAKGGRSRVSNHPYVERSAPCWLAETGQNRAS
ncbi:hypothetical protein F2Q69_00012369 [Brassica cretica]|uniref:Uncharacterized protein n=1 Tax=Brassica cretica TaxID=69181 RepID=A0A8S9R6V4_BRACR|nr:hypothetical protein F2Q69_00012369 [Brassica cretica]